MSCDEEIFRNTRGWLDLLNIIQQWDKTKWKDNENERIAKESRRENKSFLIGKKTQQVKSVNVKH